MQIRHSEIGVCGLSCRLCPRYHAKGTSRCSGCKGQMRMAAGCPFITCAVKHRHIEFCWDCPDSLACERWARHRELGRKRDSFVCYGALEDNIAFVGCNGLEAFVAQQQERESLLQEMLAEFDDGRSKSYYCIAATMLELHELQTALEKARQAAGGMDARERAKALRAQLEAIAGARSLKLALRK